jgi:hypothetical protein
MSADAILVTYFGRNQHPVMRQHIDDVTAPWRVVAQLEVRPPSRGSFDKFDEDYPWHEAAQLQQKRYNEICDAMAAWPNARVIYMGFVTIPPAVHLGSLFGQTVDVAIFQHHHGNLNWRWPSDAATPKLLAHPSHSPARSSYEGDVLLRVAASYTVAVDDTQWIVAEGTPEYHLSLDPPSPDGIRSRQTSPT